MKTLIFNFLLLMSVTLSAQTAEEKEAITPAQGQLDAYNARNLEQFLSWYSDSVEIYRHPDQLMMKGKEQMRPRYKQLFDNSPELHCELQSRMVMGNKVIDHEKVSGHNGKKEFTYAIAIYEIKDGLITKVWFL